MKHAASSAFLERHVAAFLTHLSGPANPALAPLVAVLVRRTIEGHSATGLDRLVSDLHADGTQLGLSACRDLLRASAVVGTPGQSRPLVLDASDRLYLHRYWHYEKQVSDALIQRAEQAPLKVDAARLGEALARLFSRPEEADQKTAAAVAALRRFAVVSGGPGTGKTTTVLRLLALLLEFEPGARVALAAPTGKAAARVSQSIRAERHKLAPGSARDAIPGEAFTVHRLLGSRSGTTACRYNAANPLPYDIVVIDEASMIGVAMMARLFDALHADARLVLLGDKDQLASVEPGAVLGDICAGSDGFSSAFAAQLAGVGVDVRAQSAHSRVQDCVVTLEHSYRFDKAGGIGRLAHAIRTGDADEAIATLRGADDDVELIDLPDAGQRDDALRKRVMANFEPFLQSVAQPVSADRQLTEFDNFRLLCVFRHGVRGVAALNRMTEESLLRAGALDSARGWYAGRPVMVTRNDYTANIFNGDVGITMIDGEDSSVVFETAQGLRHFATARLPEHETVYAMTVHKSQGSEFGSVLLALPDEASELLGRELIYTAVTRARARVEIHGAEQVLRKAIATDQARASGLRDRLAVQPATGRSASGPPEQTGWDF